MDSGTDAGSIDAGTDGGSLDAGTDAGVPCALPPGILAFRGCSGHLLASLDAGNPFGSFVEDPPPADVLLDPANNPQVANFIDGEVQSTSSHTAVISASAFSPEPRIVAADAPLVSVALVDNTGAMAFQAGLKAHVLQEYGVPVPSDYVPPGSSDDPATFYTPPETYSIVDPDGGTLRGRLWDLFRLRPAGSAWDAYVTAHDGGIPAGIDPRTQAAPIGGAAYAWECQNAARVLDLSNNPGYPVDRHATTTNPADYGVAEATAWGTTATHLLLLPLMLTEEDVYLWQTAGRVPDHALGLATILHPPSYRWPAQARDATIGIDAGSPVVEGMRLRLPPGTPVPTGLTSVGRLVFEMAKRGGFVVWDHSASVSIRAEHTVQDGGQLDYYGGVAPYLQLENFPWASLEVVATGSQTQPNPGP